MEWCAVVLAGGRGSRLGGADKAALTIGDAHLLDLVLADLPDDLPVVVAGPERSTARPVRFVADGRPFGGPVAGLAAALPLVRTPAFVLLAVDMPGASRLAPGLVAGLAAADGTTDAVVPVDAARRRQPLAAAYRTDATRAALTGLGDPFGRSMRSLLDGLRVQEAAVPAEALADIDTAADLARLRRRSATPGDPPTRDEPDA